MQREILFKAKRIDNGEWVQGDLLTHHPHHGYAILEHGCIYYAATGLSVTTNPYPTYQDALQSADTKEGYYIGTFPITIQE